jgi:rhamnosyltransferase
VPTLNPGEQFKDWLTALKNQSLRPDRLVVVDSASTDTTVAVAIEAGFEVNVIQRDKFSHGGTRQQMVKRLNDCEIVVFMTQDALLSGPRSLANLVAPFRDRSIAAAYGRQLPVAGATAIEAHARLFNYPDKSHTRSKRDVLYLGIKTSFISNSFAAWRRSALIDIGGFPDHTIQNEDAYAASKLIMAGHRIAYCAEATVLHSHRYGYWQEFRRYFDIGVFHARDRWIRKSFGQAGSEGLRYVKSEIRYLARRNPLLIPSAVVRTALKLIGFKLGCLEGTLPVPIKKIFSMNRRFWNKAGE